MTRTLFVDHTLETAPAASRRLMETTGRQLGHVPSAVRRLASSPHLLDGFLKISAIFEATTLDPVAREVVVLTVAVRNGCHVCIAMHTAKLTALGAGDDMAAALQEQQPLADERLEAVRVFTLAVITAAGEVSDAELREFLRRGYTAQNALEVVLGIGAYTLSTLANRMTRAPMDL